jgi:protein involved in polysaccharide export with SLBB domain
MLTSRMSMSPDVFAKPTRAHGPFVGGGTLRALLHGGASAVLLLFLSVADAHSQTPSTVSAYHVVVGDVLQVDVVGRKDISGQYTVDKDGAIKLPVLGSVQAEKRTTSELATDISRRISLVSREVPQVTVSVLESFSRKNFVLGAVMLPGPYSFAKAPTVWEAISAAGGAAENADLSTVQVISESQVTPVIVDLASAMRAGTLASLPRLHPGDTVRVPWGGVANVRGAAEDIVYIFGAVGTQGPQPLTEAPDLVRALIRSGPAADADYTDVMIVRKSGPRVTSMKINMEDYLGKATYAGNPGLQPGDTIYLSRKKEGASKYLRLAGALLGLTATILVFTNYNH